MPVASLKFVVVADDADDVYGGEGLAHHGEEFEADGHEGAGLVALFALLFFP